VGVKQKTKDSGQRASGRFDRWESEQQRERGRCVSARDESDGADRQCNQGTERGSDEGVISYVPFRSMPNSRPPGMYLKPPVSFAATVLSRLGAEARKASTRAAISIHAGSPLVVDSLSRSPVRPNDMQMTEDRTLSPRSRWESANRRTSMQRPHTDSRRDRQSNTGERHGGKSVDRVRRSGMESERESRGRILMRVSKP